MSRALLFLLFFLACDPGTTSGVQGALRWAGAPGESPRELAVAFGLVPLSSQELRRAEVENTGSGPVTLAAASLVEVDGGFSLATALPATVEPGRRLALELAFRPGTLEGDALFREARATLTLQTRGEATADPLTALLGATAVRDACDLPEVVDFGFLRVGEERRRGLVLLNPTPAQAEASWRWLSPTTPGPLSLESGDSMRTLPPWGQTELGLAFRPTRVGKFEATLEVRPTSSCGNRLVRLTGTAVQEYLEWPQLLDCGYVPLDFTVERAVRLSNLGSEVVVVSGFAVSGAPEVTLGAVAQRLELSQGQSVDVPVRCRASRLGQVTARLGFDTSSPRQPRGQVTVALRGGGPVVRVEPGELRETVGRVGGTRLDTSFVLRVTNEGTRFPSPEPAGNLRLARQGMSALAAEVVPAEGTGPLELSAALEGYDPVNGLAVGGEAALVRLRLSTTRTGVHQATLRLHSNDVQRPVVEVPVRLQVDEVPPCELEAAPTSLDFGVVQSGTARELPVAVTNRGPGACFLTGFQADEPARRAGAGVRPSLQVLEIPAGARRELPVHFEPRPEQLARFAGVVRADVNSPVRPSLAVAVSGEQEACGLRGALTAFPVRTGAPGCVNAALGNRLDSVDPAFSMKVVIDPAPEPDLRTVQDVLGPWLRRGAPGLDGGWAVDRVTPSAWATSQELALVLPLTVDRARRVLFSAGVDNGLFVWLNGRYVGGAVRLSGIVRGEFQTSLELEPGFNFLQLLLADEGGPNGVDFEISSP